MLKISRLADYATMIMHQLALRPDQRYSAAQMAKEIPVSLPTISKILKLLHEASLVSSTRGSKGGYQLINPPEAISLIKIISAIEGDLVLTSCSQGEGRCVHEAVCGMRSNWQMISEKIIKILEQLSLADLKK